MVYRTLRLPRASYGADKSVVSQKNVINKEETRHKTKSTCCQRQNRKQTHILRDNKDTNSQRQNRKQAQRQNKKRHKFSMTK